MLIRLYLMIGSNNDDMESSQEKRLSNFLYVSDNGEIKHEFYTDGVVAGIFQWEENLDFFIEYDIDDFI